MKRTRRDDPISLRVSLTESCQLRCRYCRPSHAVMPPPGAFEPWTVWRRRILAVSRVVPIAKLRFTGGEPLLYPDLLPLVEACAAEGLPDLAMTSNGFRLTPMARSLRQAGLSRVNLSIDALDPDVFRAMTGARPEKVIGAVDACLDAGLRVKLNAVILEGINDGELGGLIRFAARRGIAIRFLEMMPIGPAAREFRERYLSGADMMSRLEGEGFALHPLAYEEGETSRNFRVTLPEGGQAVCGFILPTSRPFCSGCRRLRLSARGELMGCLAQPDALELASAVQAALDEENIQPLRELVAEAFAVKSRQQRFEEQRAMVRIGG